MILEQLRIEVFSIEISKIRNFQEISALTQEGLKSLFDDAVKVVLYPSNHNKKK